MVATEQQWEFILGRYEKLIWKICHNISGDNAIASLEDNYQDLCIAALDAIRGFQKKTGEMPEDFLDTVLFGKYLKTCLWNHKNNKGAKITKKYPLTKKQVSMFDNEEVLLMEGQSGEQAENSVFFREIRKDLADEQRYVLKLLLDDRELLHPSGKVNVSKLSRKLGVSWPKTKNIVSSIGKIINNEL